MAMTTIEPKSSKPSSGLSFLSKLNDKIKTNIKKAKQIKYDLEPVYKPSIAHSKIMIKQILTKFADNVTVMNGLYVSQYCF